MVSLGRLSSAAEVVRDGRHRAGLNKQEIQHQFLYSANYLHTVLNRGHSVEQIEAVREG